MSGTSITHVSWGKIEVDVDGTKSQFKDCKVWPGGAENWDWRLTGTQHQPGIQPADVSDIVDRGVEVVILSRGMQLRLETCDETVQMLKSKGIECHVEETKRAVELFNQLTRQGKRVGGVFHTTC